MRRSRNCFEKIFPMSGLLFLGSLFGINIRERTFEIRLSDVFLFFFLRGRLPVQCRCLCFASTVFAAIACQYSVGRLFSCLFSLFFFFFFFLLGAGPGFVLCLRLRSTKVAGHPLLHLGRVHASASSRLALLSPGRLSLSLSLCFCFFFFLSLSLFLASACLIRLCSMNTNCGNMAYRSFRLKGVQLEMSEK